MILAPLMYATSSEPMSLSVSPEFLSQSVSTTSGTTTKSATLTITGGVAPYTVVWTTDNVDVNATSPTATTTTFNYDNLPSLFDTHFVTVTVEVTDAASNYTSYYYFVTITRSS